MSQQTLNDALITYPVLNADISSGANISASKVQQHKMISSDFGLDPDDTPAAKTKLVYVAQQSATLTTFRAMLADTGTSTDVSFDLKKNGTTVLTATVDITNSETDNTMYAGTITTTGLSSGDVLTVELSITSSTGALGPYCEITLNDSYIG
jgi:hypothetical protein